LVAYYAVVIYGMTKLISEKQSRQQSAWLEVVGVSGNWELQLFWH